MSRKPKLAVGVALVAALAAGIWWVRTPAPGLASKPASVYTAAVAPHGRDAQHRTDIGATTDPIATGSLRGTEVDGDVRFAADGNLIPDAGLRRLFDYHLSTIGETDLAGIRSLLRAYLQSRFDATQTERVLAAFERYVAYQRALMDAPDAKSADPAVRLAAAKRLRRDLLGQAMADGFFAEEEALADLSLKRRDIAADPNLSTERKRALLAALDRESAYDARVAAELPERAALEAAEIERRNPDPAQRHAERTARWGADAARRLAALDAEQAEWDTRVRRYAGARDRILNDPQLVPAQREAHVVALRARMFNPLEQRRIAALDAIGELEATLSTPP